MSLADIKAKIGADSQAQIRSIESENDAKIRDIKGKLDAEVKALRESYASRLAKEEPEVLKRREIVAELDAKRVDLGTKQRLIGEAFDAALRQMTELPADKYVQFADRLMTEAVSTKRETVLVGKNEKHLDQRWLDGYNSSHQTSLTLSPDRADISGGFILRDDRIDTNCSWEMLIGSARSELESEVVKRLFS